MFSVLSIVLSPDDAYDLLESIATISGTKEKLKKQNDSAGINNTKDGHDKKPTVSSGTQPVKRPPINFYKCGLHDGDKLVCIENPDLIVFVKGERKVLFNNELTSLSAIMNEIKGHSVAGTEFFTFNGELLIDIAKRTQWKN